MTHLVHNELHIKSDFSGLYLMESEQHFECLGRYGSTVPIFKGPTCGKVIKSYGVSEEELGIADKSYEDYRELTSVYYKKGLRDNLDSLLCGE